MASLDNIYDMIQKLDETNTEYLFVLIQKGTKRGKADVFFSLTDDKSLAVLEEGLNSFKKEINRIKNKEKEEDDDKSE